ncbi:MAG TPA: SLC13 family permease, partial [Flavobacteriales bacterium]|nr:SLC13 family permease [Flavobacteriales bacterium]
ANSGIDQTIGGYITQISGNSQNMVVILALVYLVTNILAMLVTNKAAVAIMFPVTVAITKNLGVDPTPFFLAIAFAGSAEFVTPYGYQTNLMVYGPGGYKFKDYVKVGWGLSVIYMIVCVSILSYWYKLV